MRPKDRLPDLLVGLKGKQMLLVLDNCEHVIDAATKLASEILGGTRELKILPTSRETLHVEGEHVFRLTPLDSLRQSIEIRAADALAFPAVQLLSSAPRPQRTILSWRTEMPPPQATFAASHRVRSGPDRRLRDPQSGEPSR